jgi:hypothetical protein
MAGQDEKGPDTFYSFIRSLVPDAVARQMQHRQPGQLHSSTDSRYRSGA